MIFMLFYALIFSKKRKTPHSKLCTIRMWKKHEFLFLQFGIFCAFLRKKKKESTWAAGACFKKAPGVHVGTILNGLV